MYEDAYRKNYGPDLTRQTGCQEAFDTYFPFQKPIIGRIEHLLRPDMRVLDVGCSTGHFLAALKGRVAVRVGLELSKDEVNFIRTRLDFPVYNEPIETAAISEGPFDLITVFQVLEHIDDPIGFLRNVGKHLKPDGILYIEVPNLQDILLEYYDVPEYADFYFREPHVSYFTRDTLRQVTELAGFTGTIGNTQSFSLLNHLHWKLTGKPQKNFTLGNSDPVLMEGATGDPATKDEFNGFIQRANREYKALVEKHGLGESVTFSGRKIS
jgi:SAM-dependent methyltransferase